MFDIGWGELVLIGVVALIVFFFGALAAGIGMKAVQRRENPDGPALIPHEAGRARRAVVPP